MSNRRITLGASQVAYRVARSARRRTIGLKVGEDGLTVVLPARARDAEAERAVREKAGWVLGKLRAVAERPVQPALEGVDGETVGYLGAPLRLCVIPYDRARTRVAHIEDRLEVRVDAALDDALRGSAVVRAVKRWRREAALELMRPKVEGFASGLGEAAPRGRIREQAKRWGSCSSDRVIRLNARLLAFSPDLVDYVCAHEACHLIEMNHSKRYYALLERLLPDHRARSAALAAAAPVGARF